MTPEAFAQHYRIRGRRRDDCGDMTVFGRRGEIAEYGDGRFIVTVLGAPDAQWWRRQRAALTGAGAEIVQDGETEGSAAFDPASPEQAGAAIRAVRCYRRKILSPEHRAKAVKALSDANKRLAESRSAGQRAS